MIVNKNPQADEQNDQSDEGSFGSAFGNSFGGAFGGSFGGAFEVKFNSDGSTSKVATKDKKVETVEEKTPKKTRKTSAPTASPIATPARTSSRTFVVAEEIKKEPVKKASASDTWAEELTRAYEKKKTQATANVVVEKETPATINPTPVAKTFAPITAPTPYRSKILTDADKKAKENTPPVTNKTASDDRGIAFAKTFLKGSIVKRPATTHTPPRRPSTSYGQHPRSSYAPRVPRKKIKNAPTLKTRVSGKSNQNILELKKHEGAEIKHRAPVVVIMGHVDHGKSTLLDYIRKSNTADKEVGGITQKMSAYEIVHNDQKITFLDTPGHEAFNSMRTRGALAADIAILVVSAEDGVKPQTLDALGSITEAGVPYFIGASKIDRDGADINKTKQSLAENNIFVEGYGGDITLIPFSGKTGTGVDDLLDMILLMTEVADTKVAFDVPAECLVIESGRDKVRGIHATLIVKNGTLRTGSFIVSGGEISPVRIMENFEGKQIKEALPGQPVRLIGWVAEPKVGDICIMCVDKAIAELVATEQKEMLNLVKEDEAVANKATPNIPANIRLLYGLDTSDTWTLPIVLKADSVGTLDALKMEIKKIQLDRIILKVIRAETGDINENDIKLAQGSKDSVVLGYNTKVDASARRLSEQTKTTIETFDIIYKLSEWLTLEAKKRAPKITSEESHGTLKILKVFSVNKHKQVLGGRVETGRLNLGDMVKILRRENEIGRGEIVELQQARSAVKTIEEGSECGLMVESKIEIAVGDVLSAVSTIER